MVNLPLEANTRTIIDTKLKNLGRKLDEKSPECNVYKEQPRTREEKQKLGGKAPDYVLYDKAGKCIGVIEAKKPNESLEEAFKQAFELYAKKLNAPIVFVSNDSFVQAKYLKNHQPLKIDGEELQDFVDQYTCLRFIKEDSSDIFSTIKSTGTTREEILKRFKEANNLLREEGLRQGFERFTALADILFLKLFDEGEKDRERRKQSRLLDEKYSWSAFVEKDTPTMLDFIKDSVWGQLRILYPKLFSQQFLIKKPEVLGELIKKLDFEITSIDTDIKGEAFEFFLKNVTNGNKDLGEYYTPRHIAKTMVRLLKPKFGETVYDPFCGTGGFLTEAFKYLKLRIDESNQDHMEVLKKETLHGREISSTARIAQMNLVFFDDGFSNIEEMDTLKNPINAQHDVVITNIPYSQKTKYGAYYDIPVGEKENADIICVQHAWKALKPGGRGAIVVPETFLYKDGKTEKLRKMMLDNCSKFSVISLPRGVFNPYTPTKTDILLFEKKGELTKQRSNVFFFVIQNDGFELGGRRRPLKGQSDLPNLFNDIEELKPPVANIVDFDSVKSGNYNMRPFYYMEDKIDCTNGVEYLKDLIEERNELIDPTEYSGEQFKVCKVSQDGVFLSDIIDGSEFTQKYKVVRTGDLVYNPHRINIGSIGIVPPSLDGGLVSKIYPVFSSKTDIPNYYILAILKQKRFQSIINNYGLDSARFNLPLEELKRVAIPRLKPDNKEQMKKLYNTIIKSEKTLQKSKEKVHENLPTYD